MADIVLTHGYFLEDDEKEQRIMRPYPPLGLLYVAAWLRKHGKEVAVFDTTFSTSELLKAYLVEEKPSILCLYVNLMTRPEIVRLLQWVRAELSDTRIVLGGPEVRYSADEFLQHGADFIVLGEGEETCLELVEHLQTDLEPMNVKGLVYKDRTGHIHKTGEREKMRNLDELPLPARDLIDMDLYLQAWKKAHGKHAISVNTMRGCPYTCKWCSRAVYGLSYRRRSPESVVEELLHIKKTYAPDILWFVDDVFTVSHKWLEAFADAVVNANAVIPFECITRADRMNEKVVQLLKKSGCFRVWIGAESGSQQVIDLMDRRVDVHQVRDMIRLTREHGMEAGTFIMLGYPGEREEDIQETVRHLISSQPDHFTITLAYPIRGTELYEETKDSFVHPPDWAQGTDRHIDFKRTYPRPYYDHAIRYVVNRVESSRTNGLRSVKHRIKAAVAKGGMVWHSN